MGDRCTLFLTVPGDSVLKAQEVLDVDPDYIFPNGKAEFIIENANHGGIEEIEALIKAGVPHKFANTPGANYSEGFGVFDPSVGATASSFDDAFVTDGTPDNPLVSLNLSLKDIGDIRKKLERYNESKI